MAELPEMHPGCLAASFAYQDQLFNDEVRKLNAEGMLAWRNRFGERLRPDRGALSAGPPGRSRRARGHRRTLVEGGLILGRVLRDTTIVPRQVLLFRDFVRLIFTPAQG